MANKQVMESLFRAFPHPGLLLHPDAPHYTIADANEAYLQLLNRSREKLVGISVWEAFPPNTLPGATTDRPTLEASFQKALQSKKTDYIAELRYDVLNEQQHYTEYHWKIQNTPLLDETGQVVYLLNSVENISDFVRTRQQLQSSEKEIFKNKSLLEQAEIISHFGTWELDLKTNELYWSDGVYRICGYTREEYPLTFESGLAVIHPDDRAMALAVMQEAMQHNKEYHIEKRFVTCTGEIKNIVSKGKLIVNAQKEPLKLFGIFQDISQQKIDQQALQKSKEELQRILDSSLDIICTLNKEGKFVTVSAASEDILGYAPQEMEGHVLLEFIMEEDHEKTVAISEELFQGAEFTNFENRYRHKDGHYVPIIWSVFWDNENEILHCVGRDGTERLKAEEQERLSQQRFKALVQDGSDLIGILTPEGNYTYVSPTSGHVLGIEPEEFVGKNAFDFIHPDDRERVWGQFGLLSREKRVTIPPFRFQHKDGTYRWIETVVTNMLEDPVVAGIVANSRDVSLQVEAEQKLTSSEKRFRALVENGADAVVILGMNGNAQYVSPSIQKVLGYTEEEALSLNLFEILHPDDLEGVAKKMEEVMQKPGIPMEGHTSRTRHKDGSWRWLEATITNMLHDPVINGIVDNFRDVTERIETNLKLQQSEKRFRALVQEGADMTAILSPEGVYQYISPNYPAILGHSEKELMGQNAFQFIHLADVEQVQKEFTLLKTERRIKSSPYRFKRKDGTWSWIQTVGTNLLEDPVIEGIVINSVEITDLVAVQEAIKQSNQRFELIMQASTESIWEFHPISGQLFLGDGFHRNFGVEILTLQENNATMNERLHPEDKEAMLASFHHTLHHSPDTHWSYAYRIRKSNGEYAHVKDRAIILRDVNGTAYRVIGAIQDVSTEHFYQQMERIEKEVMELSMRPDSSPQSVIASYLLKIESLFPDMKASVLEVKNNTLYNLASPSMPPAYMESIHGIPVGENQGSCGTAAFLKKKIIVSDVFHDTRWEKYKHLAETYGFAACWSQPVFNAQGEVVATLANYYPSPRMPKEREEYAIDRSQRLLSILLSRFEYLQNIQESNERYDLVNKATKDAIYDWDVVQDEYHWGDAFQRIFGHDTQAEPFRLADWVRLMHPADAKKHEADWEELMANPAQDRWHKEFRFKRADGSYAYAEEIGHLIRNAKGKPLRMIGVLRDVSRNKRFELQNQIQQELANYFKKETSLAQTLHEILPYLSGLGNYKAGEIWLMSGDKTRLNLLSIYADSDQSSFFYEGSAEVKHMLPGEGIPGTVWQQKSAIVWEAIDANENFIRKEAAQKAGLHSAFGIPLLHKDHVIGVLVLLNDMLLSEDSTQTAIYEPLGNFLGAEIRRKQQEEEMRLLFQSAPDIMAIASPNGHFVKVNPAFCETMGYTQEELTTKPFSHFLHPEDLAETVKEYDETITGERQADNFINRYRTRTGNYRWISWSSSDTFGEDGCVFAYGRDITETVELRKLLDNASYLSRVGGWEVDLMNNVHHWSSITKEIHEVPKDFVPTMESALAFYQADYREMVKEKVSKAIAEASPYDFEAPIITAKNTLRWVRSIGYPEFSDGKCVRLWGSIQDIHERKLIALRLQNISNNIPGILFQYQLNSEGTDNLFYVSEGAREVWGLSPEECTKSSENVWRGIRAGGDLEEVQASIIESAQSLERWHARWRYIMPDGSIRYHEGFGNPQRQTDGSILWDSIVMDITEKHDLEILAERTAKMARVGSWELSLPNNEEQEMYWSPMTREILEVEASYNPTFTGGLEFYLPASREKIDKAVKTLIASGVEFDLELLLVTAKGNMRWVRCIGQAEHVNGQCVRIYGSFQDIHQQKNAELELKETLAERNTILESIGDGFIAIDKKFIITYWNQAAEKLLGPKKEEALGKNLWDIYGDAVDTPFYINYHKAIRENIPVHFEEYYPTLGKWFEISSYPNPNGLSVYFRDTTQRKMGQEQIRLSNERFTKVAEATNDAIWDWDIANNTLYWGDGFRKMVGYQPEKMEPTMELYKSLIHPEDIDRVLHSIDQALQQAETIHWQAEYRYKRIDGKFLYVIDKGAIIRNEQGEAVRMVGAVQDLSHHKEYEESLKKLNEQLAKNLKELAVSNAELEQFAYVASHDLQEPLRMITSFLSQLEKKYNPIIDERGKQYIQFAVDGAKRMRQIILDLLEFSRVGRSEDATQTLDLNSLLGEVTALFRRSIEEQGASIHWADLPSLKAQQTPMRQLFQNLISNALKYQKANTAPHIEIKTTEKGHYWEFSVSDNGIGIAPEYSEKIFTIFQRLHNKGEYSGTGMGLAICKKIVENMEGKIWVQSEEGKGSTFYFTLPK